VPGGEPYRGLEEFDCPLGEKKKTNPGHFIEGGYEVDHKFEREIVNHDDMSNSICIMFGLSLC